MARKTFTDDERRHWAEQSLTRPDQAVADEAGVARTTVRIWRAKWRPGPKPRGRPDLASTVDKQLLAEQARKRAPQAWAAVDAALASDDVDTRLRGATIVFDRGWGKPVQDTRSTLDAKVVTESPELAILARSLDRAVEAGLAE